MTAVKELAYTKINLFLDACEKRSDGFHELRTVMHSLSLADEVTLILNNTSRRSIRLVVEDNRFLPTDSKNLAYLAAESFLNKSGIDADITLKLKKRIPVGGGLGGGSSDAAAVLRGLNRLFKRPFTDKMLLETSKSLGSDVPFCLIGGTALCLGRGEKIHRINAPIRLHTVIVNSGEHISTPWAFRELDRAYNDFDGSVVSPGQEIFSRIIPTLEQGRVSADIAFNIFEEPILNICPKAKALKDRLMLEGASFAMMSGSGSSVFGVFENEQIAKSVEYNLRSEGVNAHYAHSV